MCFIVGDFAHPYFALGWKALEAGWYTLSKDQFKKALDVDPDFYTASIGLILSHDNFGYGGKDDVIGSYKTKLQGIDEQLDIDLKLTKQFKLILKALLALHNSETLEGGLQRMNTIFSTDSDTKRNYILRVIAGNVQLLLYNAYGPLARISKKNVFALHYLTHNLNPYGNGRMRTSLALRDAAISAVFTYQALEVDGAWQISADCIDIAEYYARWSLGKVRLDAQRNFMFRNIGDDELFRREANDIITNGLEVKYMSLSLKRISEYERLHFFELQVNILNCVCALIT